MSGSGRSLQRQINEVLLAISDAKRQRAENFTIKQMERTRKSLETRLEKLNDQSTKDDTVTFEELGHRPPVHRRREPLVQEPCETLCISRSRQL
ncbi:MAG: hypothetical protein ACLUS6_11870 [Dysosmobacter sp.]